MGLHKNQTNSGSFKKGQTPWNKRKNSKYERCERISVEGKIVYLHRHIWEEKFGEIPKGFIIHHKDGNTKNNLIENLQIMTQSEHLKLHQAECRGEIENR